MNNILFILWVTLIIYVLLETDAVPKWGKLLRMSFLRYEDYDKQIGIFGNIKYKDFLLSKYQNFFIYLVTCQECLCVWVNILSFAIFPKVFGGWWLFGATTLGCIAAIALFKFILRKLYE